MPLRRFTTRPGPPYPGCLNLMQIILTNAPPLVSEGRLKVAFSGFSGETGGSDARKRLLTARAVAFC